MATSGTYAFSLSVDEAITEALERCGKDPQAVTGYVLRSARRSMNLLFAEWATQGVNYWTLDYQTLALVQGTSSYTLPLGTLDIFDAVLRRDGQDTILERLSISDYNQRPDKTTEGRPVEFMLDRQSRPVLYVYRTPENSTDTIRYWRVVQIEDASASAQDLDITYRWYEALCAGLAAKIAVKIAPDKLQYLQPLADSSFEKAAMDEGEKGASIVLRRAK